MKYLAFDCSGEEIIVCARFCKNYAEKRLKASGTEHLMVLINEVLKKVKMDISEVECVAVGLGPGSWTGSRVGVVTAYGFVSAKPNLKIVTFNSFDLISYNDSEKRGKIYLTKAYADFVYASIEGDEPCVITRKELDEKYGALTRVATTNFIDGVCEVKQEIKDMVEAKISRGEFKDIKEVEPIYLRLSQAEYQFMEKNKGGKI